MNEELYECIYCKEQTESMCDVCLEPLCDRCGEWNSDDEHLCESCYTKGYD